MNNIRTYMHTYIAQMHDGFIICLHIQQIARISIIQALNCRSRNKHTHIHRTYIAHMHKHLPYVDIYNKLQRFSSSRPLVEGAGAYIRTCMHTYVAQMHNNIPYVHIYNKLQQFSVSRPLVEEAGAYIRTCMHTYIVQMHNNIQYVYIYTKITTLFMIQAFS